MKFRLLFLGLYGCVGWLSLYFAFALRFYFDPLPFRYDEMLMQTLPVAIAVKALAADGFGLTRCIWRFASFRDIKSVFLAAVTGSAVLIPLAFLTQGGGYPNGPLLLDFMLTLGFFTAIRFSGRFCSEANMRIRGGKGPARARVLILGADERGEMATRLLQSRNRVIGFLDDRQEIQGRLLLGIPVLGALDDLVSVLEKHPPDEVVIALEHPSAERIRAVFEAGSSVGCRVSLMPEFSPAGPAISNPIRELKMSDFLGRDPVKLDPAPLEAALGGMTVLVTGAGGSIGSELCRQISSLPVKKLLLLDQSENGLFEISEELKQKARGAKGVSPCNCAFSSTEEGKGENDTIHGLTPFALEILLCDIRFRQDLEAVFQEFHPEVVYHAAACKHVPMMELHPLDAARTNVLGTRNVVELATRHGVKRLLHVSTDKVVEAEGVMGASKAWGEEIVRAAGYSCVRFGNVLGSSGSVIPLFEKQWSRHGHLQVTHRDATRYFMTIEEAVLLILHAESLKGQGEVYILDMGEPVKILDMAKQMLALKRGQKSEVGGQGEEGISIVGLRPGERVHERLHTPEEELESTPVTKVNKLSGGFEAHELNERLQKLEALVASRNIEEIRKLLLINRK